MLEKHFGGKAEKTYFNSLKTHEEVMDWLDIFIDKRRRGEKTFTKLPELPPIVKDFDPAKLEDPSYVDSLIAKLKSGPNVRDSDVKV